MNKDKWNSLSPDLQKIFTDVSQQWIEYHAKVSTYYDKAGLDYFNTQANRKEVTLSKDESARWVAAVQPLVTKTVADIKAKSLPGDDYLKYIKERIAYWTAKAPSDADCYNWTVANVKKP